MTRADLENLREDWDLEAKAAQGKNGNGELPKSFWETYSAFANTDGGVILLGVKEKSDRSFEICGLKDAASVEQTLWNLLNNRSKVSVNLLERENVKRLDVEGAHLLLVTVPRADRTHRPVYLNGNPLTGTYRRRMEGDYLCSKNEVRRMMADSDGRPRDGEILPRFGLEDLDEESLATFRNLFRSNKPNHPFLAGDDKELLKQIGGWSIDRDSGTEGLTLAGLLMLGKQRSILDRLPYYHLDYREMPSDDRRQTRWLDRVTVDGTWSGNLFEFYRRVFKKLTSELKVPFRLETPDLFRRDETPVHEALREALVNSLIHADYTGTSAIRVFKKSTGFEFINPGTLRMPVEAIWNGGRSDCRNRALQTMFQMIGAGEKAGSGFLKIKQAWEEQHWRAPAIEDSFELNETTLRLSLVSLYPEDVVDGLSTRFGSTFASLDRAERAVLVTIAAEGSAQHRDLLGIVGGHPRDLTMILQSLMRKGLLIQDRPGRGCSYSLSAEDGPQSPLHNNASLQDKGLSLQDKGLSLQDKGLSLQDKGLTPANKDTANKHESRSTWTEAMTQMADSKRIDPAVGRQAILDACRDDFMTPKKLAEMFGRKEASLFAQYIRPLIDEGLLERLIPDKPSSPNQAYRAVFSKDESNK